MQLEKIGDKYRALVGNSDHHLMYQWMPDGYTPGAEDEIIGELPVAPPAPPVEEPPEITTAKTAKRK